MNFYLDGTFKVFEKEEYNSLKKYKSGKGYELIYYDDKIYFMNGDEFYTYKLDKNNHIDYIDVVLYKNKKYVYFVDKKNELVYLLNKEGEIEVGFPVLGNNPIKIRDMKKDGKYKIIVPNNNYIYSYDI